VTRADTVREHLQTRIASEEAKRVGTQRTGVLIKGTSLLPPVFLVPCLIWLVPSTAEALAYVGVSAGCLAACIVVWNLGSHFTELAGNHANRATYFEGIQLYVLSVPEEEWPASELLRALVGVDHSQKALPGIRRSSRPSFETLDHTEE
jgi:hypothetical protein